MKTITKEQITEIMQVLMDLNIPVKPYIGLQELFAKLPEAKTE